MWNGDVGLSGMFDYVAKKLSMQDSMLGIYSTWIVHIHQVELYDVAGPGYVG